MSARNDFAPKPFFVLTLYWQRIMIANPKIVEAYKLVRQIVPKKAESKTKCCLAKAQALNLVNECSVSPHEKR